MHNIRRNMFVFIYYFLISNSVNLKFFNTIDVSISRYTSKSYILNFENNSNLNFVIHALLIIFNFHNKSSQFFFKNETTIFIKYIKTIKTKIILFQRCKNNSFFQNQFYMKQQLRKVIRNALYFCIICNIYLILLLLQ